MHEFFRHLPSIACLIVASFLLLLASGATNFGFSTEEFRRWRTNRRSRFFATAAILFIAAILIYLRETGFFLNVPGM